MRDQYPPPTRGGAKKKKAEAPPPSPALEGPLKFLSTAFGASYLMPPAPGTAGMLVGVGLWWLLGMLELVPFFHFGVLMAFFLAGVWITQRAKPYWGSADTTIMSFDSMVGFMIAAAPFTPGFHPAWKNLIGATFAVYWLLDVIQPFPISAAREAPEGWGIMLDDTVAGIITLLIMWGGYNALWKSLLGLDAVVRPLASG